MLEPEPPISGGLHTVARCATLGHTQRKRHGRMAVASQTKLGARFSCLAMNAPPVDVRW